MAKRVRQIIKIDEDKCNGCGACIPACKEGALAIIDGKARLVNDVYCDGLGACLGTCPRDAISIERREVEDFDEGKVEEHLKEVENSEMPKELPCGCPGMMAKSIKTEAPRIDKSDEISSQLTHWPIQLALIPANAPYLKGADLLLLADCTAVAYANLHRDFIAGKVIAMACPKLDDASLHVEKLARVIEEGEPKSIEVVMMEVPCCQGLYSIAEQAMQRADRDITLTKTIVSVEGRLV